MAGRSRPNMPGYQRAACLWSAVLLLIGLGLSAALARWHHGAIREAQRAELAQLAQRGFDALAQQLANCALLVRSVQTIFLASEEVTADEFERAYDNIGPQRLFPSLVALAYAERRVDEAGNERFVTTMAAPRTGNESLLGLDVGQQPSNLEAVWRSRDHDEPAMSARFQLVQLRDQSGRADGVVIRLPVFAPGPIPADVAERRARMVGSVAVSFRVGKLIETALPMEARRYFGIHISDISDGDADVLYDTAQPEDMAGEAIRHRLAFGGRTWELRLTPRPDALPVAPWTPWATFAAGALASVLLAALVWSLIGTRARALHLATRFSAQFRDSEARFRALNELLPALVALVRAEDLALVYANQAARERFAVAPEDGQASSGAMFGNREALEHLLRQAAESGRPVDSQPLQLRGADGRPFWATVSVSVIELGGQPHLLVVANDITELRELNDRLSYQASHDALTDLYNRREFERRLEEAIAAVDAGGPSAALLYVDLDQFKLINDTCGHYAGDQLLAQLALVLHHGLRPQDIIARLGGDEFGILLTDVDSEQAMAAADRVRNAVDDFVFTWEQKRFSLTASIGIVMIDRYGMSRRELLSLADTACYMAKERGRNRAHLFSENDLETARRRTEMEWVNRLRRALAEGRFELDYQEIEPLKPSRLRDPGPHIELLVRLRDEEGQRVPPGAFIPAAERFGVMPQIDRWVVETALANFTRLHPAGEGLAQCAINLSVNTVEEEQFADDVLAALERHGVPAHKLCFEITETAAVGNMSRVVRFMQRLRAVGCRFALDDFGAGMASFGYLKELPVDILKIDGSFIRNIETDAVNYSIVRAVTDIGHQVGLEVIAEWVVNERGRELLRGLGVDFVQGFAIHQPQPVVMHARHEHVAPAP
ncbi:bifunctional diguanylate cyclase/phosphodiesterase [Rehaibacterium terrae]|uniref:Diguanylate cyclase (GGDEF)-like protein/PAS domain S-box-containing protein n=1 Tax=Rehaibacterium terrae TaxID=1341696 RepID=A0A7W7Y102_9GAMM|nr:EAL domain-containing protein [Rehaibacterium terrae]MBB5016119.1 diguanylate cyclase (GGDEF)-like protein/PAS domain S-box-containing protein [Rehaibacterium terrae]